MENKKYFLGLDIGTNSVGWAVTDESYRIRKYKNNLMWGVHLFDEAQQSADRRSFRTARRRIDRRKQRIALLQEFFASEIVKKDPYFFMRLKESALLPQDSEHRSSNILFDDKDFTDKDYYDTYPTIHHLINELMENGQPHDVRLVYLACAYILAHRGHFLSEVDKNDIYKVTFFPPLYDEFIDTLKNVVEEIPFDCSGDTLKDILSSNVSVTEKAKKITILWFNGKKPKVDPSDPLKYDSLIKLIGGGRTALSDLFMNPNYKELETDSISVSSSDFTDTLDALYGSITEQQWELLSAVKKMYDWSLLVKILDGENSISKSKIKVYEQHKKDLSILKTIIKKYLDKKTYDDIFRNKDSKENYIAYISSPRICSQETFCKFVSQYIGKIECDNSDKDTLDYLIQRCENKSLCPKQVNTDNRVIPYQLYYYEMKCILDNASKYLPFLNEKDEDGAVADKILSIMEFRIPYYVGPLVGKEKSKFAWMKRKAEGRILPWNYEKLIDLEETENRFIRNMTSKCTYLASEEVLPKNSLLYCKYSVLNEINNITVDGNNISVDAKQKIYSELFMNKRRVTVKMIASLLLSCGEMRKDQSLGGIDTSVKSSLRSYHDFKDLINNGSLSEADVENIIERVTVTTDIKRLKLWLGQEYPNLSDENVKYIAKLRYQDYGRLSRRLLEEVYETDSSTGEVISENNIISRLWNSNENLMQLLGSKYKYIDRINALNTEWYSDPEHNLSVSDRLKEMYVPTAVRRSINRTLDIVKDIKSIIGKDPDKIFIEMAREPDEKNKGKRTESRKEKISGLFAKAKEIVDAEHLADLEHKLALIDDGKLRSEKYYLYFMQLGRCMYTGNAIDFDKIGNDAFYNIDHIWPQARVKDDSLDNKVLVESEANGEKSDTYPIKAEIRNRMHGLWQSLRAKGLISDKKYQRLTRNASFTDDELAGFIARQLVETRQSTKAAATIIKELCPDSELVYVKAGLTSEFRQEMDMLKCREINDLHHAKDAYLNIVMGNVYNTRFTKDPLNFIKSGERYSLKMFKKDADGKQTGLLTRPVKRNGITAWDPNESFEIVRRMMLKNSIRYVRYAYKRKGGLFDQMPKKKNEGLVPRKKGLDSSVYGGYNNKTASLFSLVKYMDSVVFIPVELMYAKRYSESTEFAADYAKEQLNVILSKSVDSCDLSFPFNDRLVKINAMLDIDGFRCNIVQKSNLGRTLVLASAASLIMDKESADYIKTVSSFVGKYKTDKTRTAESYPGLSCSQNCALYSKLIEKLDKKPFSVMLGGIGKKIKKGFEVFKNLSLTEQTVAIFNVISVLKTGRSTGCDLKLIGESGQAGVITLNSDITKTKGRKDIRIIDQSPTGLIEKKSVNLLEL